MKRRRQERRRLKCNGWDAMRDMNKIDACYPELVPGLIEAGSKYYDALEALRELAQDIDSSPAK